ncbi:nitrite reductase small subunit NirD [Thalassotalea sp. 1_MG-2023]|uniref:nitrite reductase small subunit NirD n=1 Tax=Thalassotalea sp. 1_MG-2023 TaxID=3062680 RepID=UPI0026E39E58|nr:nitrite reductase small subunit NirD [Thalassotalea sp. 1_MG-2023]MDO6425818.1 nitrite reductase small subunit NirD [Thalassotalea sp. 1_MG-2023]
MTTTNEQWINVCKPDDLIDNAGVCALINDNQQVALFSLPSQPERVFAITNYDPIGSANVLYRGIVGCQNGEPIVASPLYKQQYSLRTGKCIQEETAVTCFKTRIAEGYVQIFRE